MIASIYRRNDLLWKLTIQDETGVALDLSGARIVFVVQRNKGSSAIMKALGDGIEVINAEEGKIEIDLSNADTDLPIGDYGAELLVVDAKGHRWTASQGRLTVLRSLTVDVDVEVEE